MRSAIIFILRFIFGCITFVLGSFALVAWGELIIGANKVIVWLFTGINNGSWELLLQTTLFTFGTIVYGYLCRYSEVVLAFIQLIFSRYDR